MVEAYGLAALRQDDQLLIGVPTVGGVRLVKGSLTGPNTQPLVLEAVLQHSGVRRLTSLGLRRSKVNEPPVASSPAVAAIASEFNAPLAVELRGHTMDNAKPKVQYCGTYFLQGEKAEGAPLFIKPKDGETGKGPWTLYKSHKFSCWAIGEGERIIERNARGVKSSKESELPSEEGLRWCWYDGEWHDDPGMTCSADVAHGLQGRTWLLVPASLAPTFDRMATRIQALARRHLAVSNMPKLKHAAADAWIASRSSQLDALKEGMRAMMERTVTKLFKSMPRSSPTDRVVPTAGSTGVPLPNRTAIVALLVELQQTIGLGVVKKWIFKLIEDSIRFHTAREPMSLRHLLLSGGIGSGRKTAAMLIAKTLHAVGLVPSDELKEAVDSPTEAISFSAASVNLLDHASNSSSKEVDDALFKLDDADSGGLVILADRKAEGISTMQGKSVYFIKREAERINLAPLTSNELAQITLQNIASKMAVSLDVTVDILQQAIENRWSAGERKSRGVYIAFDMSRYLMHELTLKKTAGGRLDAGLKGFRSHLPSECSTTVTSDGLSAKEEPPSRSMPVELQALFDPKSQGDAPSWASTVGLDGLGLPATVLMKQAKGNTANDEAFKARVQVEKAKTAAKRAAIDAEVEALVGMEVVKKWFEEMKGKVLYVESSGNPELLSNCCMNMRLTGNPGCGKTTLARLVFRFLRAYDVLKRDTFVDMNALELKGKYVGHTAPKVAGAIRSAMGGVLFLDEAYALAGTDGRSDCFSEEAIRTLLTEVENNRTSVMVILAGYRDKMSGLMRCDPGLPRRFPIELHLQDYDADQLCLIAVGKARESYNMTLGPGVDKALKEAFKTTYASEVSQHNGGLAVRLVDEAVSRFATRMGKEVKYQLEDDAAASGAAGDAAEDTAATHDQAASDDNDDVGVLTVRDFDLEDPFEVVRQEAKRLASAEQAASDENAQEISKQQQREQDERERKQAEKARLQEAALRELEGMIGFNEAKLYVHRLIRKIQFVQAGGSRKVLDTCKNLILVGNPGVGKTTFARIIHKVLYAFGVVKEDVYVEKNALQLKGEYVGQTSPRVSDAFAAARGGTLFLDEAYSLAGITGTTGSCGRRDTFANDAISTLLTEAENNRTNIMVILAGYAEPMQELLDADPGMRRRFPNRLALKDYSCPELARIATKAAVERFDCTLGKGVEAGLAELMRVHHSGEIRKHNASLPIRLVEEALSNMTDRIMLAHEQGTEFEVGDLKTLTLGDFSGNGHARSTIHL